MIKSDDLQQIAIFHRENRGKATEIAKLLPNKVNRSTIHRWICRYKQSGSVNVMPKSGRPRRTRTTRFVNLVKKRLASEVHQKSIRTMAHDFKSTFGTIRRVLAEDLGKKCNRKINAKNLKQNQKPIRKPCCTWIRKNINTNKFKNLMLTDEKIFTKQGYFNPHNDVV